jgi:hypothetical protein
MAKMFAYHLRPDCTIAANVQGWAGWIEQVLTTIGGWTVTADTGQTPPASLPGVALNVANQKVGFRIYEMHDDFTDDFPIFMKVEFGSGYITGGTPSLAYGVGLTFSFGRSTNGAGQLSGILWNGVGRLPQYPTVSSNNSNGLYDFESRSYASADNSRFVLGMFIEDAPNQYGTAGSLSFLFSLERSRDISGNYTGDGLQITYCDPYFGGGYGSVPCLSATKYIICADGGQPLFEMGLSYAYPNRNPVFAPDGKIPVGLHCHSRGVAQQPGTNTVVIAAAEVMPEGQFTMNLYGADHVYQHMKYMCACRALAAPPGAGNNPLPDAGIRACMRYD